MLKYREVSEGAENDSMSNLNKDITPNRGVELMLTGGKIKQSNLFHLTFKKIFNFLKRELIIYFEFSIKTRKVQ